MKNLKNLKGVKTLSRGEQKSINGGKRPPFCGAPTGTGGSGIVCGGNQDCPNGEGCFIEAAPSNAAHCHCL